MTRERLNTPPTNLLHINLTHRIFSYNCVELFQKLKRLKKTPNTRGFSHETDINIG